MDATAHRRQGRNAGLLVAFATLAADPASKAAAIVWLSNPARVAEVPPFQNLRLGFNTGVTLGMLSSLGSEGAWLLGLAAFGVAAILAVMVWRTDDPRRAAALSGIAGGALGHVADRPCQGTVTDLLDLHLEGWHWPTFDLANAAIVCAVGVLLVLEFVPRFGPAYRADQPGN